MSACPFCGSPAFRSPTCIVCVTVRREVAAEREVAAQIAEDWEEFGIADEIRFGESSREGQFRLPLGSGK